MQLSQPVEFHVLLQGRKSVASVIEIDDNPMHHGFRVKFEDGHEDTFFWLDNGRWVGDLPSSKPYANAVKDDLYSLVSYEPGKFYYTFIDTVHGEQTNIWVFEHEREDEGTSFAVYYLSDYRFQLKKVNGNWFYKTKRVVNPEIIDPVLAKKIGHLIDSQL